MEKGDFYCGAKYRSVPLHVQESAAILNNLSPCMCTVMTFPVCVPVSVYLSVCIAACCVWGLSRSSHASNDILLSHCCHSRSGFPLVCTSRSTECSHWPAQAFLTHSLHRQTPTEGLCWRLPQTSHTHPFYLLYLLSWVRIQGSRL